MTKYNFVRINKDNISDLLPIYLSAFGEEVPLKILNQKFDTKPFGAQMIGYIAYTNKNEPAAFYGIYPCIISYKGQKYLASQSGDTMTHQNHQGNGLFTLLAKKTYELAKKEGINLVFGFPNENSFPGFIKKLDWVHFDNMVSYQIRVKCIPWIRLKNLFKLPKSVHDLWCKFIFNFLKNGTPFNSSCTNNESVVVDHSKEFFGYKVYSKNYLKRIGNKNIWFKYDDMFLLIGDMEFGESSDFEKTLKQLKFISFICGLPHIRFQCSMNTIGQQYFSKYGKEMEINHPIGGLAFNDMLPLEKLKFTLADNDTF